MKKIILFTASACPIGRTMRNVLEEVTELYTNVNFSVIYIDAEPEMTNRYGIQTNPSTLLIDEEGREITRILGFNEVEDVLKVVAEITEAPVERKNQQPKSQNKKEKSVENYTIYLYKGDELEPIDVEYYNPTSVITPRITLINLLLKGNVKGITNPFPPNTVLKLVEFSEVLVRIHLNMDDKEMSQRDLEKMENSLLKTLHPYGMKEVEIISSKK